MYHDLCLNIPKAFPGYLANDESNPNAIANGMQFISIINHFPSSSLTAASAKV